jgi:hypothetical protein
MSLLTRENAIEAMRNPFDPAGDGDRHAIWKILIAADSDAFVAGDWSRVEGDFDAGCFEGIRCNASPNPDDWRIAFATLDAYRDAWLAASREFLARQFEGLSHREAVYARTRLTQIDLAGERALAHKQLFGQLRQADGTVYSPGNRQTIYRMHKQSGRWKIVGFLGQLPLAAA